MNTNTLCKEVSVSSEKGNSNRALDEVAAGIYANVSVSSLRKSRMDGKRKNRMPPPTYVRLGRKIVYLVDDLDLWLENNRVNAALSQTNGK